MSKNIDELTPEECQSVLREISTILRIGKKAQTVSVILTNIQNATRRSECLSYIESIHTRPEKDNETGEIFDEPLLGWGDEPEAYFKRYKEVIGK